MKGSYYENYMKGSYYENYMKGSYYENYMKGSYYENYMKNIKAICGQNSLLPIPVAARSKVWRDRQFEPR